MRQLLNGAIDIPAHSKSQGFTLIELMISLVLGVVLSLGLIQLFISTRQTYIVNSGLGLMMENANAAINTLTTVVGFAGHQGVAGGNAAQGVSSLGCWAETATPSNFSTQIGTSMSYNQCLQAITSPCTVAAPGTSAPSTGSPPTCSYSSYVQGSNTFYYGTTFNSFGLQNYNTSTDSGTCWAGSSSAGPFANGAVTCAQSATVDYVYMVGGAATQGYNENLPGYVGFVPYFSGRTGDNNSDSGKSDSLLVIYSGDAVIPITDCLGNSVNQYTTVANFFTIQRDSNNNPYLACAVYSMNTLTNTQWALSSAATKIASGVEAFRVIYGQDTDFDGAPNQYITSTGFTTYGLNIVPGAALGVGQASFGIVGVRVALLMRTDNQVSTVADTKTYSLFGFSYGSFNDNRIRKVYAVTLNSNECLPAIRSDCQGAQFWGGMFASWANNVPVNGSVSGYIKLSQVITYPKQAVAGVTYGCSMDAAGNLYATQNGTASVTLIPYLQNNWNASTSPDGKFNCYFK